jgi:hypothetical protein
MYEKFKQVVNVFHALLEHFFTLNYLDNLFVSDKSTTVLITTCLRHYTENPIAPWRCYVLICLYSLFKTSKCFSNLTSHVANVLSCPVRRWCAAFGTLCAIYSTRTLYLQGLQCGWTLSTVEVQNLLYSKT